MAGSSAGSIQLDLELNRTGFDRQLSGIGNMAKKAGLAIAAAFSVKALVDFSKSCINLGSDLAEVQNVVDVTFTSMSAQVDKFAKDAAVNLGLSETMAKKYMGTIGAMSKSLGFSEKAAYDMSEGIASLAGDVASFYNISQDSAFDKLQSIFTGTLLPLREFGINMSQAALQEYALRNGITKSIDAMSEQEKVMLRYRFVMDGLKGAQGDFLRTSDGWANQVRVLKLQFDSLKATIGQGLINVLLPVVKMINGLIGRVMSLANAFKAFTDLLSGGKSSSGVSVSKAATDMSKMEQAAGGAGKALDGAGGAAKKAAKDIANATTGIDELNIINKPDSGGDNGSGGGSGGGSSDYSADEFDMGALSQGEGVVDSFGEKIKGLIGYVKELAGLFKEGFTIGFGDTSVIDDIQGKIKGIERSVLDIFSNADVQKSAEKFMETLALNFGKVAGSMASIGATIALNLLGGLDKYLQQNSGRIKQYIVDMLDISARKAEIIGNFSVAVADIFTVFRGEQAQQLTADLIGIFVNSFMSISELSAKIGVDLMNMIAQPIVDNSGLIKTSLDTLVGFIVNIVNTLKNTADYFFTGLLKAYDTYFKPFVDSLTKGFSEILQRALELFDQYLKPVLEQAGVKFHELAENHLKPLIDRFFEFFGKVTEGLTLLWETVLKPFVLWFMSVMAQEIANAVQTVTDVFFKLAAGIADVASGILKVLGGIIDFIVGVFTGNWKKAWEGIKSILDGIWDIMKGIVNTAINVISAVIDGILRKIKSLWDNIWTAISTKVKEIWQGIKTNISTTFENIKTNISTVLETIKAKWSEVWSSIKDKTSGIWNGIWSIIKGCLNNILNGMETMVNGAIKSINKLIEAINDVADSVPGMSSDLIPTIPSVSLPRLAQGGYVKANTPQLAMIGDNKYQGEVVAPEGKLLDMARIAADMSSQSRDNQTNERILTALEKIADLIETLDLTVNLDNKEIARSQREYNKRLGFDMT